MDEQGKTPAGWYSDPDCADTKRFWDGEQWTSERATKDPAPGIGPGTIAIGILVAVVVLWVIYSVTAGG